MTKYTYDFANRLLTETNPLSKVTTYTYDGVGNRATKLDANGNLTTYTYDAARQLRDVAFQDGTRYEYGYDTRGNRTLERSPTHERLFAHDELGRISTVTDVTLGRSIGYAYDATGNRTSLSEGGVSYGYAYDVDGRLMQVTDGAGRKTAFKYDALGRRTEVLRPNGVRTSYSYDAAHQVQDILHERGGLVLLGFRYGYDESGNRISKKREDGTEETYGYDSDRRLTDVVYGGARSVTYTLDALGNRTAMTETTVLSAGSTSTKSTSYSNNFFNQLVSRFSGGVTSAYAYDNNGNLLTETTGTEVKSYTWDLDNRLRQVVMPTGAVATYEYDANGLRTKKVESGVETRFLLDGPSVVAALDSLNATTTRYLTHPQVIDEIVSFEQGGAAYYPLTDAVGSVYAVTDASGVVVRSNSYDVYGERRTSGAGPNIIYGFTGREHDALVSLNYHRDRYMDPGVGRWGQPDRLGMVDGPNVYAYVRGQPTMSVDPHGMSAFSIGMARSVANVTVEVVNEAGGRYLEQAGRQDNPWLADALADYGFTLIQIGFAIGVAMAVQSKSCATTGTRRPWAISRANTSKVVAHPKFGKFYQHDSTKLWYRRTMRATAARCGRCTRSRAIDSCTALMPTSSVTSFQRSTRGPWARAFRGRTYLELTFDYLSRGVCAPASERDEGGVRPSSAGTSR